MPKTKGFKSSILTPALHNVLSTGTTTQNSTPDLFSVPPGVVEQLVASGNSAFLFNSLSKSRLDFSRTNNTSEVDVLDNFAKAHMCSDVEPDYQLKYDSPSTVAPTQNIKVDLNDSTSQLDSMVIHLLEHTTKRKNPTPTAGSSKSTRGSPLHATISRLRFATMQTRGYSTVHRHDFARVLSAASKAINAEPNRSDSCRLNSVADEEDIDCSEDAVIGSVHELRNELHKRIAAAPNGKAAMQLYNAFQYEYCLSPDVNTINALMKSYTRSDKHSDVLSLLLKLSSGSKLQMNEETVLLVLRSCLLHGDITSALLLFDSCLTEGAVQLSEVHYETLWKIIVASLDTLTSKGKLFIDYAKLKKHASQQLPRINLLHEQQHLRLRDVIHTLSTKFDRQLFREEILKLVMTQWRSVTDKRNSISSSVHTTALRVIGRIAETEDGPSHLRMASNSFLEILETCTARMDEEAIELLKSKAIFNQLIAALNNPAILMEESTVLNLWQTLHTRIVGTCSLRFTAAIVSKLATLANGSETQCSRASTDIVLDIYQQLKSDYSIAYDHYISDVLTNKIPVHPKQRNDIEMAAIYNDNNREQTAVRVVEKRFDITHFTNSLSGLEPLLLNAYLNILDYLTSIPRQYLDGIHVAADKSIASQIWEEIESKFPTIPITTRLDSSIRMIARNSTERNLDAKISLCRHILSHVNLMQYSFDTRPKPTRQMYTTLMALCARAQNPTAADWFMQFFETYHGRISPQELYQLRLDVAISCNEPETVKQSLMERLRSESLSYTTATTNPSSAKQQSTMAVTQTTTASLASAPVAATEPQDNMRQHPRDIDNDDHMDDEYGSATTDLFKWSDSLTMKAARVATEAACSLLGGNKTASESPRSQQQQHHMLSFSM